MLRVAYLFLIATVIAAQFGFGHIYEGTEYIGRVMVVVFGVPFVVFLVLGLLRKRPENA